MTLPRFRLHLLTCIVLMFTAGGLLWANLSYTEPFGVFTPPGHVMRNQGWPFLFRDVTRWTDMISADGFRANFHWSSLIGNCLICFALLIITAVICESLANRIRMGFE